MKQKVRFIRTARGLSKSSGAVPEQTATTVDELVGSLTRSVYDMSSVATHVAKERKAVVRIKLYVVAVLHEMLENLTRLEWTMVKITVTGAGDKRIEVNSVDEAFEIIQSEEFYRIGHSVSREAAVREHTHA